MRLAKLIGYCFGGVMLISLATANTSQAATFIDTTTGESTGRILFGEAPSLTMYTFGQTFFAPTTDNILNDFSFFYIDLIDDPSVEVTDFRAFVAAFDRATGKIIGDVLFESASQSTIQTNSDVEQKLTINTGGLTLTSDQEYVVFLSAVKDLDGVTGYSYLTYAEYFSPPDEDGGGTAVNSFASTFSDLISQPFSVSGTANDFRFRATFTSSEPVPEPTSVLGVLALGAFGGVAAFKRKRKQITLN